MAQEMKGKIPKVKLLFHQVILNAKIADICGCYYCIHILKDLQELETNRPIEEKGVTEFSARAEVFFVPNDKGGVFFSTGERLRIRGVIKWESNNWKLETPLFIKDKINTLNIKKYQKDEQGDL